jgi:hypothetical protein
MIFGNNTAMSLKSPVFDSNFCKSKCGLSAVSLLLLVVQCLTVHTHSCFTSCRTLTVLEYVEHVVQKKFLTCGACASASPQDRSTFKASIQIEDYAMYSNIERYQV